ncbi:YigZ family protein [Spirochaeta cellobiosiphila]|uniref:YigZ family protein n=1 Tax=Spirochaeta cellobiosiphila TaxID=504483 RepID=UPI0012EB472C|nr:YigZ family protein [Spirochaeta cellobiosiphila]
MRIDKMMYELITPGQNMIEIKRSKFMGFAFPVKTNQEARERLKELRKDHPLANHIVYAFQIGTENSITAGLSDDGEPHGTAGKPVMDVLKGACITNILIAIVRYFGGTKLGTGGLVKAYSESTQSLLSSLTIEEQIYRKQLSFKFEYTYLGGIKQIIQEYNYKMVSEDFFTEVSLIIKVPNEYAQDIKERLIDYTKGSIEILSSHN